MSAFGSRVFAVAAAAIVVCTGPASAAVITFEGFENTTYNAPITRSGFDFGNVVGDEPHFHEADSTLFSLISNGTGVLVNDFDSRIYSERSGGGAFVATSIDVASSGAVNSGSNLGLMIEGFLGGFSVGVINVPFDLDDPFQTVSLLSLGSVDRIVFDGISGGFELDNATFDEAAPVPEPATLLLLGSGLGGLALRRRRAS